MTKSVKAPNTARFTNAAIVNPTERQVLVRIMHHRLVDAGITGTGFSQYFFNIATVFAKNI